MNRIEAAYASGMTRTFESRGIGKKAAAMAARLATAMEKKAALLNFSDYPDDRRRITLSQILIPLLASAATGYIAYNAGLGGSKYKSAFSNIKNYLGRTYDKYIRDVAPTPAINLQDYV